MGAGVTIMGSGNWTRRQAIARLGAVGGVAAAAGIAGRGLPAVAGVARSVPRPTESAEPQVSGVRHFVSRPDLTPPEIAVTESAHPPATPGYFFLTAPASGPGPGGAMILDRRGDLVWFSPDTSNHAKFNFSAKTYRRKPVLTWWEGVVTGGHGEGAVVIADTAYHHLHTITAKKGLSADLHELVITAQDTALVTAYRTATADLSGVGGPASGVVLSGVVQEIDIATGKLLFEWDSLDHVDPAESYEAFSGGTTANPFDYFHINSIEVAADGDLLISARNTWAIYRIARPSGAIRWRLGGKKSSFARGPGASFFWQHHARLHGGGLLSLFDDGAAPEEEKRSRALILSLDTQKMQASVRRQYVHPHRRLLATAMGSTQVLPDGRVVVGWGTEPYFSEFSPDGTLLVDGQITADSPSYRVFRSGWSGDPEARPTVAARHHHRGDATVYASWNGATDVHAWKVLAGRHPSALAHVGSARRAGFETAVTVHHAGPYFAAEALNARGHVLGRSAADRLR
jgi:hypothetical protein